jgi:threonine synthase
MSDLAKLAKSLVTLAEENRVSRSAIQKILNEKTRGVFFSTGRQVKYDDLLRSIVDVDFVARLERRNDDHTISNKTFDFSRTTIRQLIQDGYEETKEQMKGVVLETQKS